MRELLRATTDQMAPQDNVLSTFESMLAAGDLVAGTEFQRRSGWSHQALSEAVQAGRVCYVEVGGTRAYPDFYLDPRYSREDLEKVTELLGERSPGSKFLFFTTPKASLARPEDPGRTPGPAVPRTPLQALEEDDVELVMRAATGYAQR